MKLLSVVFSASWTYSYPAISSDEEIPPSHSNGIMDLVIPFNSDIAREVFFKNGRRDILSYRRHLNDDPTLNLFCLDGFIHIYRLEPPLLVNTDSHFINTRENILLYLDRTAPLPPTGYRHITYSEAADHFVEMLRAMLGGHVIIEFSSRYEDYQRRPYNPFWILITQEVQNVVSMYFVYTASEDLSELKYALLNTERIPWTSDSEMFVFEVTFERFASVVSEVAKIKGLDLDVKKNYMMWLPEPVDCSPVPEDMYLQRLNLSHVTEVNSNWPHQFPGSEVYLSQQITNNYCLGLFRKSDNKLASSALSFHSGGVFVLYSNPEFRGQGCAEHVVRNLSNELHKEGRIPFATILLENIPSKNLFTKIGFQHFMKICFLLKTK
ncbi:uncharacterized protein LOC128998312 isoform X2 [Macrosteles quadrilineatus]|uniref:uncharacterized protein LOC128998312 isoform X2 n=1 Tax=Macrosteles quadrilineatus TaxID=74068 RepID=UPI0023E2A232|nr:uncharacterized protein LOC128998312 isoform X2 [Macrosteles quadrilineatus]